MLLCPPLGEVLSAPPSQDRLSGCALYRDEKTLYGHTTFAFTVTLLSVTIENALLTTRW